MEIVVVRENVRRKRCVRYYKVQLLYAPLGFQERYQLRVDAECGFQGV
jgi:hypothetical protein